MSRPGPREARNELAVGLVGYGLAGSAFHAPLIAATAGLRLAAVVTRNPERAAQARRDHPGVSILEAVEQLWQGVPRVDLVVIASPNRTHVPLARAALEAGRAVVVDKPLAATAGEARRLVEEAEALGLMLTVFQNRRWDGDFLTVRRLLEAGELGEALRFESRFERWRPTPKPGWREEAAPESAGGLLYDLGSHLVDQALVLFGPVRWVYAELDRRRAGVEVDDDGFVALTHVSGVRTHLWTSSVAAQLGPRLRVLGSRAAYVKHGLDVQEAALRGGDHALGEAWGEEPESEWGLLGAGDAVRRVPTERGDYRRFYAGVVEALAGAPPPVNPGDAVATLEVIEAALRSAAEARVVELPEAGPQA